MKFFRQKIDLFAVASCHLSIIRICLVFPYPVIQVACMVENFLPILNQKGHALIGRTIGDQFLPKRQLITFAGGYDHTGNIRRHCFGRDIFR